MNREQLKEYEPFFGGYFVCDEINRGNNFIEFRVKKQTPGSHKIQYAVLRCYSFPCKGASSAGVAYPAKLRRLIADTEMMMKLRNCQSVVKFYSSSVLATDDGFEFLILIQDVFPLSQIADLFAISRDATYSVVSAVCDAVSSFRSIGISHKKICPENIFVDSDGKYYLGDFGVGMTYMPDDDYITPEEYNVSSDLSSADIYQIGMLFYKLLNKNRGPFLPAYPEEVSEENRRNALMRRMNGEKINITPNILAYEEKIIEKACAFAVSERYRNIASLKSDIDSLIGVLVSPLRENEEPSLYEQAAKVIAIQPETEDIEEELDVTPEIYVEDLTESPSDTRKLINGLIASIAVIAVLASCLIAYSVIKNKNKRLSQSEESSSLAEIQTSSTTAYTTSAPASEYTATTPVTSETVTAASEYTAYSSTQATTQFTLPEGFTITTTEATSKFTVPETEFVDIDPQLAQISIFDDGERTDEIVIAFDAFFGSFVSSASDAAIYEYNSGNLLRSCYADTDCMYDEENDSKLICDIHIPEDFIMDFENCTYKIVFEEGSIKGPAHSNNEFSIEIDASNL